MSEYKEAPTFPPLETAAVFFFLVFEMTVPLVLHKFTSDSLKVNFSQKANSAVMSGTLFLSVLILSHFAKPLFILSFSRSCLSWFRSKKHVHIFLMLNDSLFIFFLFFNTLIFYEISRYCFEKFCKLPHNDHFCIYKYQCLNVLLIYFIMVKNQ